MYSTWTRMCRRVALLAGAIVCWSVTAAVPAEAGTRDSLMWTHRESFERDWGGWRPDTDGLARKWLITRTTARALDGRYSLAYSLDGANDNGTIWIERVFPVPARRSVTIQVSFWLYSPAQSVTAWPVVGVAGTRDPEVERDLPIVGYTDRTAGWAPYSFTTPVSSGDLGVVWVAVGISATWEVVRVYHVDLVATTITPA